MKKNQTFSPPDKWDGTRERFDEVKPLRVFLAGTIDNGLSVDWQRAIIEEMGKYELERPIKFYNPRRDNWDNSLGKEDLHKQIAWELCHLEKADVIIMNILGGSKSPISLLELGLFAKENKVIVFCPPTYYRFDNVKITCQKYDVKHYETNDILVIRKVLFDCLKETKTC